MQNQIEACMPDSNHTRLWQGKGCRTERQAHTQQLTFMRECSMTLDLPILPVALARVAQDADVGGLGSMNDGLLQRCRTVPDPERSSDASDRETAWQRLLPLNPRRPGRGPREISDIRNSRTMPGQRLVT